MRDFKRRRNKKGAEYGCNVAVYATPEHIFVSELVKSAYEEAPEVSRDRIVNYMKKIYPVA